MPETETPPQEQQPPLEPPASDGTGNGAEPPPPEPVLEPPTTRVKAAPEESGHYMVLLADKPKRGEGRPQYVEVGYYQAHSPDAAKRKAHSDPANEWLRNRLNDRHVFLRAVAAAYWPRDVKASGWDRPDPQLEIR